MKNLTRRRFLAASALGPLATRATAVRDSVPAKASPFDPGSVRLLDGPLLDAAARNREFLHGLETDRLLHTFRLTAHLPSNAEPLGGWEKPDVELRGHFTGHFLSACALSYAGAGDELLRDRGRMVAAELAKCQKANGGGYISAFPLEFFDRLKAGQKVWAPWYTIHKILAGLLDMYVLAGDEQALDVARGLAGWTKRWTDAINDEQMARIHRVEFGGMNEVLYNLYAVTGEKEHAATARRFEHQRIFGPLAEGRDELKGLHVNTQIPKIIGAARAYELTGDPRYQHIAQFFWTQVTAHRSYCTGGTSNEEHWRSDPDKLAAELSATTQECCCTYNMLKLTRHLFAWSPEARYFDYYERALYNGIAGTINPRNGLTTYYVPLASGYWKIFASRRGSFWCCTGTGAESFSKLADSIYFHDPAGLYVNLFIPSELDWAAKGMKVRQETVFPERGETLLRIESREPRRFALRIREPYWTEGKMIAAVNGQPAPPSRAAGYVVLERAWQHGDQVRVTLPMSLHAHPMQDDPGMQAMMYGPVVLAGDLGTEGLTDALREGGGDPPEPNNAVPAPALQPAAIEPVAGRPLRFRAQGIELMPLNQIVKQRYAVYWRVKPA